MQFADYFYILELNIVKLAKTESRGSRKIPFYKGTEEILVGISSVMDEFSFTSATWSFSFNAKFGYR